MQAKFLEAGPLTSDCAVLYKEVWYVVYNSATTEALGKQDAIPLLRTRWKLVMCVSISSVVHPFLYWAAQR